MNTLAIGGVPEHFNLPWNLAVQGDAFSDLDVEVRYVEYPQGTGEMMRAVNDGEIDVALVLTEGAVAHIAKNGSTGIIGTWVESPLVWGVHCAHGTTPSPNFPHDARIGISRPGSGSHLMPLVHARQEGWAQPLVFVEISTLAGAIDAFASNGIDAFYWERTMTWPNCEAEQMSLHGVFSAPWPAFVAVCRRDRVDALAARWTQILERIERFTEGLLRDRRAFIDLVSESFGIPRKEIRGWLERTTFRPSLEVSRDGLAACVNELVAAGILAQFHEIEELVLDPAKLA